jgi:hypothetical protein
MASTTDPPPDDGLSPGALSEAPQNPLRREIGASLARHAPVLGELYEGAIMMLQSADFPGRPLFIAHAVREIVNRLPEAFGVTNLAHVEYANACDEILKRWRQAGLPIGAGEVVEIEGRASVETPLGWRGKLSGFVREHLPERWCGSRRSNERIQENPDVSVPKDLFRRIRELLEKHVSAQEINQRRQENMFSSLYPDNEDAAARMQSIGRELKEIGNWAVAKVHVPRNKVRDVADDPAEESEVASELERWFGRLEVALGAFFRQHFATTDELDKILEETNS